MSDIIIVSNRLPVTVGEEIKKSAGGLAAALEGVSHERGELKWIGNPGGAGEDLKDREKIERVLQEEYGFVPLFFTEEESKAYYEGFSNSSLWPLLHYMTQYFRYEAGWWEAYQKVNRKFADKVLSVVGEGDTVWVHDYHLMLLPAMLREAKPDLRSGFFLHTPFPSYEIFRCHPRRRELIEGLLGADLIGFHTFGYMRHFRSSALRLLGIESEMTRIRAEGHVTTLGVYPVGIHAERFVRQFADSKHAEHVAKIGKENEGKKIVLSVERLDYTKGIRHRLDAIDAYLAKHEKHDDVKFVFVSVPSREGVREYQSLLEEIEQRIGQLNGKYATLHNSPIHFIHGTVDFAELCALYARADVAIVTPLIDGMNLVAKEYIACQKDHPGVLILSEFAGAAEELFNALIVNPYDPQAVAEAIEQALAMSEQERTDRMTPMRKRVMKYDAQWWARKFIEDLSAIDPHVQEKESFQEKQEQLAEVIARGGHVGLFLDYDGTLREIQREPQQARPNEQIKELFKQMAACPGMEVTIISGRRAEDLEAWFGEYGFGLIAEHGANVRLPGMKEWQRMDQGVSYAWKEEIGKLLQQFEDQTPGSFVEDKPTSLVWHYRKSDPEFGEYKARLLASELAVLAANEPVVIRHGDKIVEVVPGQISKGAAVQRIVEAEHYDLVVCAGDDQTDESMFRLELDHLITIKVGEGDTLAKVRLASPAEFRRFLEGALAGRCGSRQQPAVTA